MARVLVIDDEPNMVRLYRYSLEADGHDVTSAGSCTEGVKLAIEDPPDVVLMDYVMPDMSGLDACRMLKANERTQDLPILIVSGRVGLDDTVMGLDAGATDYITKPIDLRDLIARVRTHVTARSTDG